ncbi:endopeptidase [Alicyclobacillus hesperidum subsp. aegles]|uniref:S1C family serine protease n=1 Tax=Alicyclobacillus hesperidum TaxID=89784 RepID=UPI0007190BD8|nr:trypsin-like peptidase domain-containing protein [Alicyclobacillus hesperidum]KRW92687.1 peptidase S1 [Alicyclobacillus tengchongensis]GLG00449.1 endopeptidase [Alicyclobacillus hesperidum subsp. aegles]
MGYYRSRQGNGFFRESAGALKWAATVVVSALVGAGATLALMPMVRNAQTPLASESSLPTSTTSASKPMSVSVNINDDITQVVKKVEPDVVAVVNYTTTSDFFTQQSQTQESDIGSGVYFYKNGNNAYIVTNNHVVQGGSKVEIVLNTNKQVRATVVGTDPYTDLAVLKVPASTFPGIQPAQFANSDDIQVGEPAIAIGTPMGLDFADTVTSGIVSGDQRMMPVEEPTSDTTLDYQSVIQTDAAINPGNSGGPLLNAAGQVIGINSSKIVEQDFEGMGFAIPSNEVLNVADQIIRTGHALHPALGIEGIDLSSIPSGYLPGNIPVNYGVYVEKVDSANAKNAGLRTGDVIISIDGKTIQSIADLRTELFTLKPGETVPIVVYRGSQKKTLNVKIGSEESPNTTASGASSQNQAAGNSGQDPFSSGGGSVMPDPFNSTSPFGY